MKLKHVIASLSLGLITAFGVSTGVSLKKEAKQVKADAGDTWMFAAYLDISTIDESWRSQCSNFRFHVWGTNVDETFPLHESGAENLLTVNCSFTDEQSVSGGQFIFYQAGDENKDKYSTDASFTYNKDSDFFGHMSWQFDQDTTWPGGKWELTGQTWGRAMYYYYDTNGTQKSADFDIDPVHNEFFVKDFVVNENNLDKTFDILVRNQWNDCFDLIYNEDAIKTGSAGWFKFNYTGTYDIIVHNEYLVDGDNKGIIEIKLHSETTEYIYLVGYDITEETALYTFGEGGVEEFGTFPGERLKNIASAEEVHGDLRFQGEEYNIWRVRLDMYYPKADHLILSQLNEYGVVGTQTADMLLIRDSAYWFSYDNDYHNDLAGQSIKWLLQVEEIRKAAENQSVCNISKEQATAIVNEYNSQGDFMHTTYINSTNVLTHKRDGSEGTELVSYRYVMEELAKIAEINLANPSTSLHSIVNNNGALIIVIVSSISVIAIASLFIIRRRRAMR